MGIGPNPKQAIVYSMHPGATIESADVDDPVWLADIVQLREGQ